MQADGLFDNREKVIKFAKTVRKAIRELDACLLGIFEKMRISQLVSLLVLIVLY